MYTYIHNISMCIYIYIYIYLYIKFRKTTNPRPFFSTPRLAKAAVLDVSAGTRTNIRPVHLLRVVLLRVLESNFPGDPLSNSMGMIIPTN